MAGCPIGLDEIVADEVLFPMQVGDIRKGLDAPNGLRCSMAMGVVDHIVETLRAAGPIVAYHVPVPAESTLSGFIMVEQMKSVDFGSRKAKFVESSPRAVLIEVLSILDACLYEAD